MTFERALGELVSLVAVVPLIPRAGGRLVKLVAGTARRMGLSITRYPPPNSLERFLERFLRNRNINCVLDVGACTGQYVRLLRERVGYRGHIVSFEPATTNFSALEAACSSDVGWRGHRWALGKMSGTGKINVYPSTVFTSFLRPNEYGASRFGELATVPAVEDVEIHALSEVLDEVTRDVAEPRFFLKVDTQGCDLEVIEGAREALSRMLGVQLELSAKPIYADQPDLVNVMAELKALGFELGGMFPVSFDRDRLRVIELDGVFCRAE